MRTMRLTRAVSRAGTCKRVLGTSAWAALVVAALPVAGSLQGPRAAYNAEPRRVGAAAVDITPPVGYPLSGYYHERLATGTKDPLFAKALVLREGETAAAIVVCDLISTATDLTVEVTAAGGTALERTPVSFNRRFLMRDGSVRTWMNLANPDVLHAAGPIDPEIGIVRFDAAGGLPRDPRPGDAR